MQVQLSLIATATAASDNTLIMSRRAIAILHGSGPHALRLTILHIQYDMHYIAILAIASYIYTAT